MAGLKTRLARVLWPAYKILQPKTGNIGKTSPAIFWDLPNGFHHKKRQDTLRLAFCPCRAWGRRASNGFPLQNPGMRWCGMSAQMIKWTYQIPSRCFYRMLKSMLKNVFLETESPVFWPVVDPHGFLQSFPERISRHRCCLRQAFQHCQGVSRSARCQGTRPPDRKQTPQVARWPRMRAFWNIAYIPNHQPIFQTTNQ